MLYLYVADIDATYKRAIEAGAKSVTEPANMFYGDRTACVRDVAENDWWIATRFENPSLEEIRDFEEDKRSDRLEHWTRRLLADKRFADYFAERLARAFVGAEDGPFLLFRRRRFIAWLSDSLTRVQRSRTRRR